MNNSWSLPENMSLFLRRHFPDYLGIACDNIEWGAWNGTWSKVIELWKYLSS